MVLSDVGDDQKTLGGEEKTDNDTLLLEEDQRCVGSRHLERYNVLINMQKGKFLFIRSCAGVII